MKKSIYIGLILILSIVLLSGCGSTKEKKENLKKIPKEISVLDHEYYKGLTLEDIISVTVIRYTEGGDEEKTYTETEEIEKNYNYWKTKKLGKETTQTCEDNTTVYIFKLKDNASISIEKECDWIVIQDKRYLIK
ncbi:MAG: hypothetical protein IJG97_04495 [Bacilli bacterium]|nr:hypothetical protein [Bacilli bacterium]